MRVGVLALFLTVRCYAIRDRQELQGGFKEGDMKVRINDEECVGDGSCVEICPDLFKMVGDLAVVKMEEVPEKLEHLCREAAEACPVDAIIIHE